MKINVPKNMVRIGKPIVILLNTKLFPIYIKALSLFFMIFTFFATFLAHIVMAFFTKSTVTCY